MVRWFLTDYYRTIKNTANTLCISSVFDFLIQLKYKQNHVKINTKIATFGGLKTMKLSAKLLATILLILSWFANANHLPFVSAALGVIVLILIFLPNKKG